jgi:hypothetical protein
MRSTIEYIYIYIYQMYASTPKTNMNSSKGKFSLVLVSECCYLIEGRSNVRGCKNEHVCDKIVE